MATQATWTVVFDDKTIINQSLKNQEGHPIGYKIDDDSFWNDAKWSNIWAIQYKDDNLDDNDTVEYRDETPHATWNNANLGDFRDQFISKWDAFHLSLLQAQWDENDGSEYEKEEPHNLIKAETEAEKIARLGPRPTSYSS